MENDKQSDNNPTEFLEELGKLNVYAQTLINDKVEHLKLKVAEESVKTVSGFLHAIILIALISVLFFFLSIVAGLAIGEKLDSYAMGFLIVAGFYFLLLILYLLLRKSLIVNPITKLIIRKIL